MTATLLPNAKQQFIDGNGKPLAGGSVYFYIPNTSTFKSTWQDPAQTILNTNPVILDASGEAIIWGAGVYRQVVYDVLGNLIWDQITEDTSGGLIGSITDALFVAGTDFTPGTTTQLTLPAGPGTIANTWIFFDGVYQTDDQIASLSGVTLTFNSPIPVGVNEVTVKIGTTVAVGIPPAGSVTDITVAANANIDSSKLSFLQSGAGAVRRALQAKERETFTVTDFGCTPVSCSATPTVDATAAFQSAANQAALAGVATVRVPTGAYLIKGQITVPQGVRFVGESDHSTIVPGTAQVSFGTGSILYINSTTLSPFVYTSGNYFKGLTFYYPDQLRTLSSPISYPATFSPSGTPSVLTNVTWKECGFVNAYFFIDARVGHLDFKYHDIEGAPLFWGIVTDGSGGTDDFQNIAMSYYYFCQVSDPAAVYMASNAIGLQVGRSDAVIGRNIFIGSMKIGIRLFLGIVNSAFGPYGIFSDLSLDSNQYAIYSEATHPIGININNMQSNSTVQELAMPVVGSQTSNIQVNSFTWWSAKQFAAVMQASNCTLKLNQGEIFDYTSAGVNVSGVSGINFETSNVKYASGSGPSFAINSALNRLSAVGNSFSARPTFFSTPPTVCRVDSNDGYNGVVDAIAFASPINAQNLSDFLEVSGSGTFTSIQGGWTGRRIFITSLSGSLTLGTGGNILCGTGGITLGINQGVELLYDGTNWRPTR